MKLSGRGALVWALAASDLAAAASDASHVLWYSQPASRDFFDALPIGNGRLGAMVHGWTDRELIRLNEETIWSGGPIKHNIPEKALDNLPTLREQILGGNLSEATTTWERNFKPDYDNMRRYQPAGELRLDFGHGWNDTTEYKRSLDVSSGICSTSYVVDGVTYSREAVSNFPHNVLAFKFSSDKEGALRFDLGLTRDLNVTKLAADDETLSISLQAVGQETDEYRYASKVQLVLADGVGKISTNGTALTIRGANKAWLLYTAETAYHQLDATFADLQAIVDKRIKVAVKSGYNGIRKEGIRDYQRYYNRASIDLGTGDFGKQNTTTRLQAWKANWKAGTEQADHELMALQFNLGRYLLIQSSRPGTLPANLQGIWCKDFMPPWDSKFTLNVNIEMNYWLAQPMDLSEIAEPVVDLLDKIAVSGREVAKVMYGADGFCCHHNTDAAGSCVPYHRITPAAPYALGAGWVAFEAIEHWRFNRDKEFARERIMPLLKGIMDFIYSYATEKDGYMITNPCCSPENAYIIPEGDSIAGNDTGIDAGSIHDRGIMWEIMTGFLEISEGLGSTKGVERAKAFRNKIQRPVAGSYGQLLEWSRDFEENEPGHRHLSPLLPVQPGSWISPLHDPEDAEKAYILLRHRMDKGGGGTSWAVVWASVQHARHFDAPHAIELAEELTGNWAYNTMLSRNGDYFQIDGNLGYVTAVIEMLLQSHAGVVHLGPAIPDTTMASGSFKGWMARGGFKVDMTWKNGAVTGAQVESLLGNPLKLRVGNGTSYSVNGENMRATAGGEGIATRRGQRFKITVN